MTRDEAEREAERLSREHPERTSYRWFAREREGAWSVVRVAVPHPRAADEPKYTIAARSRPPYPDDPRQLPNVGGPHVAGG